MRSKSERQATTLAARERQLAEYKKKAAQLALDIQRGESTAYADLTEARDKANKAAAEVASLREKLNLTE